MTETSGPVFSQLNLVVADMTASLAFYRRLGLDAKADEEGVHAAASLPGDLLIEWDTAEFAKVWDSGSRGPRGGSIVLNFRVPARQAVDEIYAELTAAGYRGRQRPYDAFWGSRYAIVDDPDGNGAGLMSPIDDAHRSPSWPPPAAPSGS